MHKLELLAPAGGAEALRAAVRGGADAVYVGLEAFNARRGAENFTLEALREAAAYAHLRGVRVYVALNTAVLPREAADALECARQAYRAGADAFIVQDIGIAAELSRTLPDARLDVSTQMNVHNAAGVRAAARLGARRVTLARELALPEIAALAREAAAWDMEVEAFAHGALCVCYSGQCLMSSLIGGRSANRGMCAQACRLPYELRNRALQKPLPAPGEHLLSPQDLCAVDLVPELLEAGVASLKVEGRMKSPEYVQAVTGVYRAVIDRVLAADARRAEGEPWPASARAGAEERRVLEEAFSRGFTTAYLEGERGNGIMSYRRPNNRGVFVGRVAQARAGEARIACEADLAAGDVLEFWTGKGHVAQTLAEPPRRLADGVRVPLDARAARTVRAARPPSPRASGRLRRPARRNPSKAWPKGSAWRPPARRRSLPTRCASTSIGWGRCPTASCRFPLTWTKGWAWGSRSSTACAPARSRIWENASFPPPASACFRA